MSPTVDFVQQLLEAVQRQSIYLCYSRIIPRPEHGHDEIQIAGLPGLGPEDYVRFTVASSFLKNVDHAHTPDLAERLAQQILYTAQHSHAVAHSYDVDLYGGDPMPSPKIGRAHV